MKTIRQAAVDLRIAQKAYMADRGNDVLGQAVAEAASALDDALAFPEVTPESLRAQLEAVVGAVGEAWDAGSIEGREGFLGSIPAATQVLFEALPTLARLTDGTIGVQEAWEAAGGNPGIQASRAELLESLKLLDEAVDEADEAGTAKGATRPVAWRAACNIDLDVTLFAATESELDDEHAWEPLFAARAPASAFIHVAWRNQIADQWVYFPSVFDPRNAHDNGKPYEKVYVQASFDVLLPRLEQQLATARTIAGNPMVTIMGQEVANALAFLNARRPTPELLQGLTFVRDAIKPIAALEGMSTTVQQAIDTLCAGPTDAKSNP